MYAEQRFNINLLKGQGTPVSIFFSHETAFSLNWDSIQLLYLNLLGSRQRVDSVEGRKGKNHILVCYMIYF